MVRCCDSLSRIVRVYAATTMSSLAATSSGGSSGSSDSTAVSGWAAASEMTYVIDGEIEVQADGQRSRVRSGGMSFVPKGVAHAFIVVSAEARLISIQSPGAPGQAFFRGASDPATDDTADVLDLARLQASASANPRGITVLGPPPFTPTAAR